MNTTKFTNKEEYLAYRSNWKAEYKQLSKDIRTLKAEMRESGHQITWSEFSQLKKLKTNATEMLEALKQAIKMWSSDAELKARVDKRFEYYTTELINNEIRSRIEKLKAKL